MNKAHSYDENSVRMLQFCESVISEPFYLIFKYCLYSNTFPDI